MATKSSNVEDFVKLLGMPSFMAFLQNLNFTCWTLDRWKYHTLTLTLTPLAKQIAVKVSQFENAVNLHFS